MGKGLNPMTLVAGVIAIAAIGLSAFMFMQVNGMKQSLKEFSGDLPVGLGGEAGETGHGGSSATSAAIFNEKVNVTYELGEFTPNTADGKYAVLDITLVIESTYYRPDMEAYQTQYSVYEDELEYYEGWNSGEIDKFTGKWKDKKKGDQASIPSGAINAAHVEKKELEPPAKPTVPPRPLTVLEQEIGKNDSKVRDNVINVVNSFDSKDIINPVGKAQFKQAIIDGLNSVMDIKYGRIVDLYFKKLMVT